MLDRKRRWGALFSLALVVSASSTGCAGEPQPCADWPSYETPEDAAAAADAVVLGEVREQAGMATVVGDVPVWQITVDRWLQGSGSDEITVASLIDHCGDSRDRVGEAQGEGPRLLFLYDADGAWATLTPFAGVAVPTSDGGVPDEWPGD